MALVDFLCKVVTRYKSNFCTGQAQQLKSGTVTNAYGFYSLTLSEGEYKIDFRYIGYESLSTTVSLDANKKLNIELKSLDIQQKIRFAIEETLRKEAKDYLPQRVKDLAEKNSFRFKKVSVRNSKTRWGSCSFDNNINLTNQNKLN